jgi:hypothetical protein
MTTSSAPKASVSAEITVSTTGGGGSTPMTPDQFVQYLHANGFVGNTGVNPNYPGVVWIEFAKGI